MVVVVINMHCYYVMFIVFSGITRSERFYGKEAEVSGDWGWGGGAWVLLRLVPIVSSGFLKLRVLRWTIYLINILSYIYAVDIVCVRNDTNRRV